MEYLESTLNSNDDPDALLRFIITYSSSDNGILLAHTPSIETTHTTVACTYDPEPIYAPPSILENITYTKKNITLHGFDCTSYTYSVAIPLHSKTSYTGIVILTRNTSMYSEDDVNHISALLSIVQRIFTIYQLESTHAHYVNERMRGEDMFMANMSHEIRTPLNGVIGYTQLLNNTHLTSTQSQYVNAMNDCSIQLMQVINDILDYSRLASGKMPIRNECFAPHEVIAEAKSTILTRLVEKRQKSKFVVADNVPSYIISDKHKFLQILINLVTNAHKFTDIGGCIEVGIYLDSPTMLRTVVKDNGMGIPEADQRNLFSAFEQARAPSLKPGSGTGLGLAICKKLVEVLNGTISMKSTYGLGSTFAFTATFQPYTEDISPEDEYSGYDLSRFQNHSVLVVDDNMDNRLLLYEKLLEWKMLPVICASAREALHMIHNDRHSFTVVLLDICMPDITGTDLARLIKTHKPYIPLIALSSLDILVHNTELFEHTLSKPVKNNTLINAISRCISKYTPPDACLDTPPTRTPKKRKIKSKHKNTRILIAEDVSYNSNLLKSMLVNMGYTNIDIAEDGDVACTMMDRAYTVLDKPYTLLLLDLRMPVLTGYGVLKWLKTHPRLHKRLQVVVVTASVMDSDKEKCKAHGVHYFINKPVQMNQLSNVLRKVL